MPPWPSGWAAVLGRPVEFHWCASAECAWHCLPDGRCDVVLGQPLDSGPPRGVAWSVPYAGAQFGLVVPRDAPGVRSLADLRGKRVGIVAGTVAVAEKDHAVARFKSREELLDGFAAAALDAAFLDADFAAWYLHEHPRLGALRLVDEYVPTRALEHGPGRPRQGWDAPGRDQPGPGPARRVGRAAGRSTPSTACRSAPSPSPSRTHPPAGSPQHLAPDPRARRAGRQHGPRQLALLQRQGRPPGIRRRAGPRPGPSGSTSSSGSNGSTSSTRPRVGELLEHACDLVFGEAVDANAVADDEPLAGQGPLLAALLRDRLSARPPQGRPAHRARWPSSRASRRSASGTEAGSIADYRLRQRGYLRRLYRNQLATLKALADGDIDYAYLWANVGWTLHASPDLAPHSSSSRATCRRTTGISRSP